MWCRSLLIAILLVIPPCLVAGTIFIDFENFADGDVLANQIAGLAFTNTAVLTAGISLNEVDFPPHSGTNVAFDNSGPMGIAFTTPILSFSAYFTYLEPLTLLAFDASNTQIGSTVSLFSNNTGTGGDPGSSPNELFQFSSIGPISSVSITGDAVGSSFVIDDVTLTTGVAAVPEPSSLLLTLGCLGVLFFRRRLIS